MSEKLARQAGMMENDPELGGVFSDGELVDAESHLIGNKLWKIIRFTPREQQGIRSGSVTDVLLKRNVVTGATLMVRAAARPLLLSDSCRLGA